VVTRYIYDAAGNLLAETDGSNNITRYYIYGLGLLAMVSPSDQSYCYHYNATGSTVAVTNESRDIVNKYAYDPFGNIANQIEAVSQPFKFVGRLGVMAEPNGFYYMRARYYDPKVGRFISEDPIGFSGGDVNLYAYVQNNPLTRIDPSGDAWLEMRPLDVDGLRSTTWGPFYHVRFRYDDGTDFGYGYGGRAVVQLDETSIANRYHRVGVYLDDAILHQARMNIDWDWNKLVNPSAPDYDWASRSCKDYGRAVINEYNRLAQANGTSSGIYTKHLKP